ncbi:MAG TPA: pseudouridine synthase [Methanothrix sp.]|nr:pseudouridine synthase [Methanothrix sp.]HOV81535.1 pseudouridine synthase [Methanothrix sp.]HPC90408.1 pseudouridine synthase [Methanothrix sp.]HQE87724.1 pseudouridine synthase [Methanothrix sp.]HQI68031.1 pseudouridine synthase [Methanothrix sp.]
MLKRARITADYQFGRGAGEALFPDGTAYSLSKTRRLRYLYSDKERIATVRARDNLLTLSMLGARRLHAFLKSPLLRVMACDDAAPFVAKGGNLFARHVLAVDPEIRAGEEVLVVDSQDRLLATGTAVLAPEEMLQIKRGIAVAVRKAALH